MKNIILNDGKTNSFTGENINLDNELKKAINNLKGSFFDLETGNVKYSEIKGSEDFEDYKRITRNLQNFELDTLKTIESKLSFWINIYNVMVVHGIVELEIKNSVREVWDFFGKVSYSIDKYIFSLDDIEHGILRGNVKKNYFSGKSFGNKDPRIQFVIDKLDPRIHFALVCGSKSCPPIGVYNEEKINQQLDLAASSFINSDDISIDHSKNIINLSKIFKWYGKDFGNKNDLISFIAKHRDNQEDKNFLLNNKERISLNYLDYNWNLNH